MDFPLTQIFAIAAVARTIMEDSYRMSTKRIDPFLAPSFLPKRITLGNVSRVATLYSLPYKRKSLASQIEMIRYENEDNDDALPQGKVGRKKA